MFKNFLLFSLISALPSFTDISYNPYQTSSSLDNSLPNEVKTIIVQQNSSTTQKENFPTIQKEGFVFQYMGCNRLSSDLVKCDLVVNNKQQRRYLKIYASHSRLIDDAGNELRGSEAMLGSQGGSNELSTDIPMKASITFRGAIGDKIKLFDISTFNFNVEFIQK
jgi:hypothetical protein